MRLHASTNSSCTKNRKTSSVGCISWLSHLLPHRHHGKTKAATPSSLSDDESDSNDAPMTSYRDVTAGRRGQQPLVGRSTFISDQLPPSSTVSPTPTTSQFVETFDVYYVLPASAHRPPGWTERAAGGEMTMTERRRPNANTLLDAVPPTPGSRSDRRAATLPASLFDDWTSTSAQLSDFEHYKTPQAPLTPMYCRPRCACVACSDLHPATHSGEGHGSVYQHPTWRPRGDDDIYYNSNHVDVDRPHRTGGGGCNCSSGQTRSTAARYGQVLEQHGRPLGHSFQPTAYAAATHCHDYDAVPTPVPLSYANIRFWRGNESTEATYSVPVRLTDNTVLYDNEDTLSRLQSSRCRRPVTSAAAVNERRRKQVPVTSHGGIMRFVELRQVRADSDGRPDPTETITGQNQWKFATEDRYVIEAPSSNGRTTPSRRGHCHKQPIYFNVSPQAETTAVSHKMSSDAIPEEGREQGWEVDDCEMTTRQVSEACSPEPHVTMNGKQDDHVPSTSNGQEVNMSRDQDKLDEEHKISCTTALSADNDDEEQTDDEFDVEINPSHLNGETHEEFAMEQTRSRQTTSPETERGRRPMAAVRLADAYLLRMSPPPPLQQSDGRRRAAYSDPVRWVAPVGQQTGTDHQNLVHRALVTPPTTRHAAFGRPNGFRLPAAGNEAAGCAASRTAATTCTNEALEEAIKRRNRKCKPSAMRRLQASKTLGVDEPATAPASSSSFEPLFEGITCSLLTRSASLSDCNALAKAQGHTLDF